MNSFGSRSVLRVDKREFEIYRLDALEKQGCAVERLPYSLRILLENLLRREDGKSVKADDVRVLTSWTGKSVPVQEIAFMPSRVLLQDFTGVPAVVDLAAMRDAMKALGGDPGLINPLQPAELVIDHSVQVDEFGTPQAFQINADLEFQRNKERYAFLRWGQTAFKNFAIVPPDTGIVHQINLEYLARVVFVGANGESGKPLAYPDTLVGTDSHTTMINGLGVLGWGVGGIEAEAAMLGQPVSMLIPQVVGFRLKNHLREGSTATDLVLTVTEMLRKKEVTDHQRAAGRQRRLGGPLGVSYRLRERLLDEAVLACLQHEDRLRGVCGNRRREHDRVELRVVEQLLQILSDPCLRIERRHPCTRPRGGVTAPGQLAVRQGCEVARQVRAPVAESRHTDPDGFGGGSHDGAV